MGIVASTILEEKKMPISKNVENRVTLPLSKSLIRKFLKAKEFCHVPRIPLAQKRDLQKTATALRTSYRRSTWDKG